MSSAAAVIKVAGPDGSLTSLAMSGGTASTAQEVATAYQTALAGGTSTPLSTALGNGAALSLLRPAVNGEAWLPFTTTLHDVGFRPSTDLLRAGVAFAGTLPPGAIADPLAPPTTVPTSRAVALVPLAIAFDTDTGTFTAPDTAPSKAAAWWPSGKMQTLVLEEEGKVATNTGVLAMQRWDGDGSVSVGGITAVVHPVYGAPAIMFHEPGGAGVVTWDSAASTLGFTPTATGSLSHFNTTSYADLVSRSAWCLYASEAPPPGAHPPRTRPRTPTPRTGMDLAREIMGFVALVILVVVVFVGLAVSLTRGAPPPPRSRASAPPPVALPFAASVP